jgi:phosphatidylserine/phosphatidylglycerophosphate/cardiolipin synthase-like enzyme
MRMKTLPNSMVGLLSAWRLLLAAGLSVLSLSGCAVAPSADIAASAAAGLPETELAAYSSAPRLDFSTATVLLDNDEAFEQKLQAVRNARKSLDLAYYIFADDYSSSLLAEELVAAARRGVRVRVLLDYFNNYRRLDLLRFLQREANRGPGSLEVRLFNRPTRNIIADAVYLTLGCGEVGSGAALEVCPEAKLAEVGRRLERASEQGHDYNSGGSGVFLSGLYSQRLKVMAHAITAGQKLDLSALTRDPSLPPKTLEEKEKTLATSIAAAKVYWQARANNPRAFQRALSDIKLGFARTFFGDRINPLYHALSAYLPLYRFERGGPGARDWDHLTDFLHHKLMLADAQTLIIGGRNVEDSYHMQNNPLLQRYRFMDTDLRVDLRQEAPELSRAFERLWDFRSMVATLNEVQAHAPNDFVAATAKADAACGAVEEAVPAESEDCRTEVFARYSDAQVRIAEAGTAMAERAERYRQEYRPRPTGERDLAIPVDPGARLFYLENLPFTPDAPDERSFGARKGKEAESGKTIHAAWTAGLRNACAAASPERPQRVVLHNAYFIPPANLLGAMGKMASGAWDCEGTELTVLTNSPGTTDLAIINFGARYPVKAVADYRVDAGRPDRAAGIRYFEYRPKGGAAGKSEVSLHSKVSVLGSDLIIGSANADVRSFMMDTNNGVFIGNAPGMRRRYLAWLDEILADPEAAVELTGQMAKLTLEQMLETDRENAQAFLARKLADRFEGEPPLGPALDELESVLASIYGLSVKGLRGGLGASEAWERYDRLLKLM